MGRGENNLIYGDYLYDALGELGGYKERERSSFSLDFFRSG